MIEKPTRGTDVLAWCSRLWQELHALLYNHGDGQRIVVNRGVIRLIHEPRFFVGGLLKAQSTWTGTVTNYLRVPFDGSAPFYIAKATWDAALTDGMPDDAEYYELPRTFGDQHVPRAG